MGSIAAISPSRSTRLRKASAEQGVRLFCAKGAEYLVPGLQVRLRPLRLAGDNRLAGGAERIGPDQGGRVRRRKRHQCSGRESRGASAETCGLIDGNTLFIDNPVTTILKHNIDR